MWAIPLAVVSAVTSGGYDWLRMGNFLEKAHFGSPVRLSVENIKVALQDIDCYVGRWMKPAQDRVQAVLHLHVQLPENFYLQTPKAVHKFSNAV